jgi:FKBP-type peptidyl-prolyl cis-trans isomerase 2
MCLFVVMLCDASEVIVNLDFQPNDCRDGSGPRIQSGDDLEINYFGTIDLSSKAGDKGQKFDSSYDRNSPFSFRIGSGQVIKGWDQGLLGLCLGSKATLVIPPELGYGSAGAGGVIPGGATLNFKVEVMSIKGPSHKPALAVESLEEREAVALQAHENEKEAEAKAKRAADEAVAEQELLQKASSKEAAASTPSEKQAAEKNVETLQDETKEAAKFATDESRAAETAKQEAEAMEAEAEEAEAEEASLGQELAGVEKVDSTEDHQEESILSESASASASESESAVPAHWNVGDKVNVQWKKLSKLYPASVSAVNYDGTFDVTYDDEAKERHVGLLYMHPISDAFNDTGSEDSTKIGQDQTDDSAQTNQRSWSERLIPSIPKMGERKYRPRVGKHWHIFTLLGLITLVCSASLGVLYVTSDESPARIFHRFRALLSAGGRSVKRSVKEQMGRGPSSEWSGMEMQDTIDGSADPWCDEIATNYVAVAGEYGDDGTAYIPVIDSTML